MPKYEFSISRAVGAVTNSQVTLNSTIAEKFEDIHKSLRNFEAVIQQRERQAFNSLSALQAEVAEHRVQILDAIESLVTALEAEPDVRVIETINQELIRVNGKLDSVISIVNNDSKEVKPDEKS